MYYCDTYVGFIPLQAQQGYADVTVYNAQMVNAQSGHMTMQGIVGQQGPTGSMMTAGQHGAMMVQGQQQVMMQQPGVMATQGMMQQHDIMQQQQQPQQQGFVGNAAAQAQMMSPTNGMQTTGIVVQGAFNLFIFFIYS